MSYGSHAVAILAANTPHMYKFKFMFLPWSFTYRHGSFHGSLRTLPKHAGWRC